MADPAEVLGLRPDADAYRPPPPVRWSQPYSSRSVLVLTTIGALLVGFLIATGITTGRSAAEAQDVRNAELVELITVRQARVDAQSFQLEELRARLSVIEEEVTGPTSLRTAVRRAEEAAGMNRMAGPGLRISFADGTGCARAEDCHIQDTDLQLAVNTAFALGAEAVAVNGERVIATTAIRSAGRAILVNYRVLSPPYLVEAIGDPVALERDFGTTELARNFDSWKSEYGLGFSFERADEVVVPAYSGSIRIRRATVGEDGS